MRYDLDQLETFLTVIEAGTITAAAARLNLSKSVISKRVSDLETSLGAALFRRNAGRIEPTEAAQRLAERIRPALADLRAATESAAWGGAEGLRGTLSISAPMSFGTLYLSPVIARFARAHPGLSLRVDYDDRSRDLIRDRFDVAVRVGQLRDSALMARKLCEDRLIPCASPEFLDRHNRPQTPADLAGLPVIGYSNLSNASQWQFGTGRHATRPAVTEIATVNNGEASRDMAIAGVGMTMLPGFIVMPAMRAGLLERVLPDLAEQTLPISVVWPPVTPMPAKIRAFVDHLAAELAGGGPWSDEKGGPSGAA
ncbi:MAG: LysR family transcriptional regulator [Paracoccus sp. (in: a-proteobacteria)]|nr:LysR family transcriptional regulator [Paracoccus sp. (in: a-proteobacteria)]